MPITNDAYGNFCMGNFIAGDPVDWTEVLSCFRQALGSNGRCNLNVGSLSQMRLAWRPNLVPEALTEAVDYPLNPYFSTSNSSSIATGNSRISLAYTVLSNGHSLFPGGGAQNVILNPSSPITINSTDTMWVVANKQSISYFIYRSPDYHYFFSQGFLSNSPLDFPQNAYSVVASCNGSTDIPNYGAVPNYWYQSRGFSGAVIKTMHESGDKSNYVHTKLIGNTTTQSEVELYLRDASTDVPYGYVPNIFKWKVDGSETGLAIGDIVRLSMASAIGEYVGQGNIFCKVVGRSSNLDGNYALTGDYLLMRVAGHLSGRYR